MSALDMPPWFLAAMAECETLALDVRSDRERLWERLMRHLPTMAIEEMIADNLGHNFPDEDVDSIVARVKAAVISAIEEA